jgi:hypothetical protein
MLDDTVGYNPVRQRILETVLMLDFRSLIDEKESEAFELLRETAKMLQKLPKGILEQVQAL